MKAKQLKLGLKMIGTLIVLTALIVSCTANSVKKEDYALEKTGVSSEYESQQKKPLINDAYPQDLKIIKSANVRYKVKNVKQSTSEVKKIAGQFEAYISDLRFQNNLYSIENRFTIKVPAQSFDVFLDSLKVIVEFVEYENISTKDVTEEYIDIEARLKTKLEVKQRYEDILRKNAKTVKDILATEEKLSAIQEEIESAQGRLNYLTNKVTYSTVQVDLYQTVEYKEEPSSYTKTFWNKLKEGLEFGWAIIENLVLGLFHIWPFVIFGILLFWYVRRRLKK